MMIARVRHRFAALVVAVLATPFPAGAQVAGSVVSTNEKPFVIQLNEGRLIRLEREANSVFIANPEIADVSVRSANLVYVFGRSPGETSFYALGSGDTVLANLRILVKHNLQRLKEALDTLIPAATVMATSIDGGIILSGSVATATEAENARRVAARFLGDQEEIINRLAITQPNQVNLRVRFAEVTREIVNQFGFNWDVVTEGTIDFALATANPIAGINNALFGASGGSYDLNVLFDALADDGLVTILAEPNLTALSGETASFLAGGEFPIPVGRDDDTITIEFKQFGVSLSFTPTILSENRISMRVRPEVSQLSTAAAIVLESVSIPSLTTRWAETTVELGSGQSFAIAGLLQDNSRQDFSKFPGLGDIPILGALFQSERFERNETELVILVTPYLVRPISEPDLALPTDPYMARSDSAPVRYPATAAVPSRTVPLREGSSGASGTQGPGFIIE